MTPAGGKLGLAGYGFGEDVEARPKHQTNAPYCRSFLKRPGLKPEAG